MRRKTFTLSVGLALLAMAPAAQAADWGSRSGGIKDRGGVAIPAPIPAIDTFKWYLRADVGGGLVSEPDVSERGFVFGRNRDPADGLPFGMSSAWFDTRFDTFATGGIGAGVYLTPRMRADLTVDVRTASSIEAQAGYSFREVEQAMFMGLPVGPPRTFRTDGQLRETTEARATVALANLYLDLAERGSRLVPYIGGGVGFAVRTLDRRFNGTELRFETTTGDDGFNTSNVIIGKSKAHQVALAAAATAGVGYTISPGMVLDVNYRYTYIGEVDFSMPVNFYSTTGAATQSQTSKLTIGDTHEHTVRAGLRWNVW